MNNSERHLTGYNSQAKLTKEEGRKLSTKPKLSKKERDAKISEIKQDTEKVRAMIRRLGG